MPSASPASTSLALGAGDPVGEQLDAQRPVAEQVARVGHRQAAEQRPHPGGVLLGEHLGRRHQRALVTALHGGEQRRLTATTVLPEPTSPCSSRCIGCGAGEVGLDLGDHPSLRAGERVRQRVVEAPHQLAVDACDGCLATSRSSSRLRSTSTSCTRSSSSNASRRRAVLLLARSTPAGGSPRSAVAAIDEAEPLAHRRGHRVGDAALARSGASASSTQPAISQVSSCGLLALRVDRHDPAGAVADQVDDRVRHLQPAPVRVGLAEQGDLQALAAAGARATAG